MDRIAVIAVCYNHEKYLVETLNSIQVQSASITQLIIVDSNSTDNSKLEIQEWITNSKLPNIVFIDQKSNKTMCENLNDALNVLQSDYFQIISCDDVLHNNKIQEQLQILQKDQSVGVVFSDAIIIDQDSKYTGKTYISERNLEIYSKGSDSIKEALFLQNGIPAASLFGRTQIFEDIGNYDTRIVYEDWDFLLRLTKSKWNLYFLDKGLVNYRILENSHWKEKTFRMIKSLYLMYDKHKIFRMNTSILEFYNYYNDLSQKNKIQFLFYLLIHFDFFQFKIASWSLFHLKSNDFVLKKYKNYYNLS